MNRMSEAVINWSVNMATKRYSVLDEVILKTLLNVNRQPSECSFVVDNLLRLGV